MKDKDNLELESLGDIDVDLDWDLPTNLDSVALEDGGKVGTDNDLMELSLMLEEDKYLEDVFDGKYYISYLGLNPLTILKEDVDVLRRVIYANYDKDKILFLIKDLRRFIGGVKYLERKIRDQYLEVKKAGVEVDKEGQLSKKLRDISNIISILTTNTDSIENIVDVLAYNLSEMNPRRKGDISIVEILRNSEIQEEIMDYAVSGLRGYESREDLQEKDRKVKLENYGRLVRSIDTFIETKNILESGKDEQNGESDISPAQITTTYKNTSYTYTEEELELLKELRFPTILATKERLIKNNTNENYEAKTTVASIELRDWHKERIYRMYNLYDSLDRGLKVSDFYGHS